MAIQVARLLNLAVAALIVVPVLLLIATSQGEDKGEPEPSPYDRQIVDMDRYALQLAYQQQVTHLFEVWMKDDTGQPERAQVGFRKARRAFIHAMKQIEEREEKLPP
jgi:hypothetical protein